MLCGKKLYGANEKVSPTTGKKCHMTWTCPTGTLQHTSTLSLLVSSSTVHILLSFTLLVLSAGINREKVWWQSCKFASLKRNLNILQSGNMSENLSTNWKLTYSFVLRGWTFFHIYLHLLIITRCQSSYCFTNIYASWICILSNDQQRATPLVIK